VNTRTARAPALLLLAAVLLPACAPKRAALLPVPPSEVRREISAKPPGPPQVDLASKPAGDNTRTAPPPGPDYGKNYRDAMARTRELLARGEPRAALPLWESFGDSVYASEAAFNRGVLLQISGDSDGAADQYRRAAAPPILSGPAAANLLGIALLRGDRELLRETVDNVARPVAALAGSREPEFLSNLAAALGELSRSGEAEAIQRSIREKGEKTPALPWNQAILAYQKGDVAAARRFSSELAPDVSALWPVAASRVAWERDPSPVPPLEDRFASPRLKTMARNLSAFEAWRKGDPAAARDLLGEPAAGNDPPAEVLNNLGVVQAELGQWREAREAFERAVTASPDLPEGWLNLGLFREVYLGDAAGALSCYDRYVTLNGQRKDEVAKWSEWLRKSPSSP